MYGVACPLYNCQPEFLDKLFTVVLVHSYASRSRVGNPDPELSFPAISWTSYCMGSVGTIPIFKMRTGTYMSGLQWKNLSKKEIALLFMLSSINCLAPLFGSSLLTFVRSCLGYCIYFDRKRRSHPDFRRKLREKRKAASRGGPGSGPALPDFADQEAVQRFFLQVQPLLSLFIQQRSRNFSYRKLLKTS